MRKTTISVVIGLIVLGIVIVILTDFSKNKMGKLGDNPYEYSVDEYKDVDPALIHYKEVRNFPIRDYKPGAIAINKSTIWLSGENVLQAISLDGKQLLKSEINGNGTCLKAIDDAVFVGFLDHIKKYNIDGSLIEEWEVPGSKCVFTSLAASEDVLYVADAGNRRVIRYNFDGELLGEFEGKAESAAGHGFIIPSPNFEVIVNSYGEIWAVNPGKHAIENYSEEGNLRGYWQKSSMLIEGFTGCCNPAEITVLEDGSFVTSEKGMVRIKVYDSSGELLSVVAAPEKFNEDGKAPEVAVDKNGLIYALDFDRSVIRVFEKI